MFTNLSPSFPLHPRTLLSYLLWPVVILAVPFLFWSFLFFTRHIPLLSTYYSPATLAWQSTLSRSYLDLHHNKERQLLIAKSHLQHDQPASDQDNENFKSHLPFASQLPLNGSHILPRHTRSSRGDQKTTNSSDYWPHMINTYRVCPAHPNNSTVLSHGSYWLTSPKEQAEKYIHMSFIPLNGSTSLSSKGKAGESYWRSDWKIEWTIAPWWEQDLGGELGSNQRVLLREIEFLKRGEAEPDPNQYEEALSVLFAIVPTRAYSEVHKSGRGIETNETIAKALASDMTCKIHYTEHLNPSDNEGSEDSNKWNESTYADVKRGLDQVSPIRLHFASVDYANFFRCPLPSLTVDMMRDQSPYPRLTIEAVTLHAPSFDFLMTLPICRIRVRKVGAVLCTKALFGPPANLQPWMVEEWFNYIYFIGFEYIHMWDKFGTLRDVAEPYRKRGLLEYAMGPRIQMCSGVYHDQVPLATICLMHSRQTASYLHYTDADEYLVFNHPAMVGGPNSDFLSPPLAACHNAEEARREGGGVPGEICPSMLQRWLSLPGQSSINSWYFTVTQFFDSPEDFASDPTYLQSRSHRLLTPPEHMLIRYNKRGRGIASGFKTIFRPLGAWSFWIHSIKHENGIALRMFLITGTDGGINLYERMRKTNETSGNLSLLSPLIQDVLSEEEIAVLESESNDKDHKLRSMPVSIAGVNMNHLFSIYGNPVDDVIKKLTYRSPHQDNPAQLLEDAPTNTVMGKFLPWLYSNETEDRRWMTRQRRKMGWTSDLWSLEKEIERQKINREKQTINGVSYPEGVWQETPSPFYSDEIDKEDGDDWAAVPVTEGPQYC